MDRQIVYPGAIPLETDLLNAQKDALVALAMACQAVLGTTTVVDGLACAPTSPASLSVNIGPGSIYSQAVIDGSAYSSLAADSRTIVKQGISLNTTTLTFTPPGTVGYSQNFLIEVAYLDQDGGSTVLPYYNASNPAVAYSGPANAGTAQYTTRQGLISIQTKAGVAAPSGTQTTPSVDAGYTALYVVTLAYGATSISAGNISTISTAPFLTPKLPALPGVIQAQAGNYTIPRNYPDWVAHLLHDPTRVEIGGCGGNTAQSTRQRDAIRFGSAIKRFQASTPASIIAARSVKIRFDRKWLRKKRHMRSTGFNSGLYGGKYIMTMLSGTTKPLLLCQPAQSTIRTAIASEATWELISAKWQFIASVLQRRMTMAAAFFSTGQTAPKM